jgi:hypothetical protein
MTYSLDNRRMQNFEEWKGGLLSASYTPQEGRPGYAPMIDELRQSSTRIRWMGSCPRNGTRT